MFGRTRLASPERRWLFSSSRGPLGVVRSPLRGLLALTTLLLLCLSLLGSSVALARPATPQQAFQRPPRSAKAIKQNEGQWFQLSHFGKKLPAPDARIKALKQAEQLTFQTTAGTANVWSSIPWTPLGPQPINTAGCTTCGAYGLNSGRITAVAVNPSNSSDLWVGAADGGAWHSTDGGAHWTPVTDSQATLSIGAIAIDPKNASTIYIGTGETNLNADAYWGAGILKSTDGGAHWTQLGFNHFGGLGIASLAIDPNNSANILAAVAFDGFTPPPGSVNFKSNPGIWRSTDGGTTWSEVLSDVTNPFTVNPDSGTDVLFDSAHAGRAYAGLGNVFGLSTTSFNSGAGIYVSNDSGATWSLIPPGNANLPIGNKVERIRLGLSADGQHIYAVITDAGTGTGGSVFGNLLGSAIWTSTTGGSSWAAQSIAGVPGFSDDDGESQWWYDTTVAVDPTDATGSTAYVGGVDIWKTTDGGAHWTNITNAYNLPNEGTFAGVHPDQHALTFFSSASSSLYVGNDGGMWSLTGAGVFANLNGGGLNITQFYDGSVGETGPDAQVYGGAQDNGEDQFPAGSPLTGPTTWNEAFGGDGGNTEVDYTNNAIVYEETPFGGINRSTNGGATWSPASFGIGANDNVNFIMPFAISPMQHNELVAGTDRVYVTFDGVNWSPISPILDPIAGCACGQAISAVALAFGAPMYVGDNAGHIYESTNGGASWIGSTVPGSTGGMITGLSVDPGSLQVYVSFADFANGSGQHIFRGQPGGTWTDVSKALPNVPFESVLAGPKNPNFLIAGSDVGVFASQDAGATWSLLGNSLPNVAINKVFTNQNGSKIFVATHGRGIWELNAPGVFQTTPIAVNAITSPGINPANQVLTLQNTGAGTLNWSANSLPSWVSVSPTSGTLPPGGSVPLNISFSITGNMPQTLTTNLVLTDANAINSPFSVPITVVAANVAKQWFFAEGYTGGSFTEFLTLANPNGVPANVTVHYFLGSGTPISIQYVVAANSRFTVNVNQDIGSGNNVSMVVTSDQPIVAERPMYFTYTGLAGFTIPGGTDVLGATQLGTSFDFGYLDTTGAHDTYLTILNQNSVTMNVTISYFAAAGGAPIVIKHTVGPNSRGTVHVNGEPNLPAGSYSALVTLDQPGLVERPLYLVDSITHFTGSADVVGVTTPLPDWDFAEGYTSSQFSERYILSNPSLSQTANVTVTFLLSSGQPLQASVALAPGQQKVVNANTVLGSTGVNNSAHVHADQPILAERLMSFKYLGVIPGATDVLGAAAPSNLFLFAEGYTGGQFSEYLTIENPDPLNAASVQVTFLPASGNVKPIVQTYIVAPNSRFTLFTNFVLPGQPFSLVVESNVKIVAERPMYFNFLGIGQTGGTDVVGYQP